MAGFDDDGIAQSLYRWDTKYDADIFVSKSSRGRGLNTTFRIRIYISSRGPELRSKLSWHHLHLTLMISTATSVNTASSSSTFDVALIAREEALDALDPLRHLMHAAEDDDPEDTATSSLLPAQRPSIHNENLELSFPNPSQPDEPVVIRLAVDASPGCGGIAWPAGEVPLHVNQWRSMFYFLAMTIRF